MAEISELLKPKEAAAILSISTRQLTDLVNDGKIKFINIGRGDIRPTRRFEQSDLDEYKEQNKCLSTKERVKKPTRMTSGAIQYDIQAIRAKRQKEKQNAPKRN
ncbi:MAG: helix-turn-helix domain-containing protein [Lentilitoribacter sp.]